MTLEIYINDQLIDLIDEDTVTASYGNISFGEISKRKGVKSNTHRAPFTTRNKLVYESCEVPGSFSEIPYTRPTYRAEISGVIVFEGFCTLEEASDSYEIQAFAGATDFYSIITTSKLSELDLSEFNHIWNETNIINSWSNVKGYMYAFVEYGKEWQGQLIAPDYMLPQIFFHTVIKQIATDAGYTLIGDVLTNDRFLKHVIIPNKFPLPVIYGDTINLSEFLPDMLQSKVWLDFANIYGLQFDINDLTKEIYASHIDEVLFNDPEEWTVKVDNTEDRKTKYRFERYGQLSKLRYKYDSVNEANSCYQDFAKDISIDDTNLVKEADIYKSEFYLIQDVDPTLFPLGRATTRTYVSKPGKGSPSLWNVATAYTANENTVVWRNGSYYKPIANGTGNDPATSPTFWTFTPDKDIWDVKSRNMYGIITVDPVSTIQIAFDTPVTVTRIINNTGMEWSNTWTKHYRLFSRTLQKTKRVSLLVKLNYSDVNQLDFTTAKRIDNELYYLEEVKQFKLNQVDSTIVELVRI